MDYSMITDLLNYLIKIINYIMRLLNPDFETIAVFDRIGW